MLHAEHKRNAKECAYSRNNNSFPFSVIYASRPYISVNRGKIVLQRLRKKNVLLLTLHAAYSRNEIERGIKRH